ncbi:MAG: class III extradiol ring-cleavage dioxygenase family protein [Eubacteriales bacterium]|nr:class III extradiol ring-cleavage dioxygenase family protein [Eubacteriales bacterium]
MALLKAYAISYPALVIPQLGQELSPQLKQLQRAYEQMAEEIADLEAETIIFVSPLAPLALDCFFISSFGEASARLKFKGLPAMDFSCILDDYASEFMKIYARRHDLPLDSFSTYGQEIDAAMAVPLYFIQRRHRHFRALRIGLSNQTFIQHCRLGEAISEFCDRSDRRCVLICLGQLATHKQSAESQLAARYDAILCRAFKNGQLEDLHRLKPDFCRSVSASDLRSFLILEGALDRYNFHAHLLAYEQLAGHAYVAADFTIDTSGRATLMGTKAKLKSVSRFETRSKSETINESDEDFCFYQSAYEAMERDSSLLSPVLKTALDELSEPNSEAARAEGEDERLSRQPEAKPPSPAAEEVQVETERSAEPELDKRPSQSDVSGISTSDRFRLPLREDPYVELAIFAIRYFVWYGEQAPMPKNVPEAFLKRKAACFVSIYLDDQLISCIGAMDAKQPNLAQEILVNSVEACRKDRRFQLKSLNDAKRLRASVDILGACEKIDKLEQLDPQFYGVVVHRGRRKGLLLPRLEGVERVEQQLSIAAAKAGIDVRDIERIERFSVQRHI